MFLAFYRNRRFITVFKTDNYFFLSLTASSQFTSGHLIPWSSILILYSHLCLGVWWGFFPSGFPTKTLYTPLPHTCQMLYPSHSSWFDHPKKYLVSRKNHAALHYPVTSGPLLPSSPWDQISSSAPYSQTPLIHFIHLKWETKIHIHNKQATLYLRIF